MGKYCVIRTHFSFIFISLIYYSLWFMFNLFYLFLIFISFFIYIFMIIFLGGGVGWGWGGVGGDSCKRTILSYSIAWWMAMLTAWSAQLLLCPASVALYVSKLVMDGNAAWRTRIGERISMGFSFHEGRTICTGCSFYRVNCSVMVSLGPPARWLLYPMLQTGDFLWLGCLLWCWESSHKML